MRNLAARIDSLVAGLIIALMAVMVVTVTWQVITRYLLGAPSSYTAELATFLLIWVSLLGAAYGVRQKVHLGIDVFVNRMQPRRRLAAERVAYLAVVTAAVAIFIYGGSRLVYVTLHLNQVSAAFRVPMGYIYSVVPLSGLLMLFYAVVGMLELRERHDRSLSEGQVLHAPE